MGKTSRFEDTVPRVSRSSWWCQVTEEVQIDIFEDEDDDADESKQRDIVVRWSLRQY